MKEYIDKSALVAEIESKFQRYWKLGEESDALQDGNAKYWGGVLSCLNEVKTLINTLEMKEVPISEDLEEAVNAYIGYAPEVDECSSVYGKRRAFKDGAKWKEHHLWKPADGDELPEIDMDVIVLTQPYPLEGSEYSVSFAHRPNPNGYDGKSLTTGKVEHYTPKIYDKGGWNIPNVKWWLDCDLPNQK